MKRFELGFTFLQLPVDYVALALAGISAYFLRFAPIVTSIRPVIFNLPWNKYWPLMLAVAVGWIIIFAFNGLYSTDPNRKLSRDLTRVFFACSTGFAGIALYVFFTLQKFDSRFVVLASWVLAVIYVCAGRIIIRLLKRLAHTWGIGLRRTVIIGQENIARIIKEELTGKPYLGYKIIGTFEHFDEGAAQALSDLKPDEIIFTDPKAKEEEAVLAVDFANDHHITFKYSADLFSTITTNMSVYELAGVPIIELRRTRLYGWGRIFKRIFDFVIALILIILFSPIYLLVMLIILIESGRPIIYKNERVGQNGKNFWLYKFRSLYQKYCTGPQFGPAGEEALKKEQELIATQSVKGGPVYKIKNDPRITPFGRFIRRWSLDEFPQFFNVLKGEMSLVGPRPHQPREVAKYQKHHQIVFAIKPGVTGLPQISGRSNLSFEEEVRLDTFYIENWSVFLDLIILVKTPFVVLLRKGAW